jgi:hypothetical protein
VFSNVVLDPEGYRTGKLHTIPANF